MYTRFAPARVPAGQVPDIQELVTVASPAATFVEGALVLITAGLIDTCGANPAVVTGVALAGGDSAPGFSAANSPVVSTYRRQVVSVAMANRVTIFRGQMTNNSSTRIAPAQTDVGVSYGVTAYTNIWTVDKNKSGANLVVKIVDVDIFNSIVFFKFLEAVIAA